jgi:phosphoenolpyruvate-protein kinase (PTS system EI component)
LLVTDRVNALLIHDGSVCAAAVSLQEGVHISGNIVVLDNLSPEPVLRVIIEGAVAVIAKAGAMTSHGAGLLREAGLPAVIATEFPTEWIGRLVVLNASGRYIGLVDDG